MKRILLLLAIIINGIIIQAQSDIIYTSEDGKIIIDCNITEVKNGNIVYYTKDSIPAFVEAVAINRSGKYIALNQFIKILTKSPILHQFTTDSLYKGHDYKYYDRKFNVATRLKRTGAILTLSGIGTGVMLAFGEINGGVPQQLTPHLVVVASLTILVGAPLWIIQSSKVKNNQKAMEMIKRNTSLSIGVTNTGVGLVLNF